MILQKQILIIDIIIIRLNHSILQPGKSNFEFLDAALLLSCDLLRPVGNLLLD